jgi:hypothetical protein
MKKNVKVRVKLLIVLVLFVVGLASGCKAMADPDGTDLNWAERESWEGVPGALQSMLNE